MDLEEIDDREMCKYGEDCYQKNPTHHARFQHPKRKSNEESSEESKSKRVKTPDSEVSCNDDLSTEENPVKDVNEDNGQIITVSNISGDIKTKIKTLFLVEMPSDFYDFYDFCKSYNEKAPKDALVDIDLELAGPYDVLSGTIQSCTLSQALRHYRYYFDVPEFHTILISKKSQYHLGYFRDDPKEMPTFVGSNDPEKGCIITSIAGNIFSAINIVINDYLKTCDPFKKIKVQRLQSSLTKWCKSNNISVEAISPAMRSRRSKIVAKTFHKAGLVVPFNKETQVGYRPLAEEESKIQNMLTKIMESDCERDRSAYWSKLQPVITFANIAVDECDFGTALELGIDMFCAGHEVFHSAAEQLMCTAYVLLDRTEYTEIVKAHLSNRVKGQKLDFALS